MNVIHRTICLAVLMTLLSAAVSLGDDAAVSRPATRPAAVPLILPGRGLAEHDFFYAGEAKTQDMYIVRNGEIAWAFHGVNTRGEISDAQLLPNGNVLFAHQFGVTLIDANQKVLWKVDAAPKSEIHTAQMIGTDRVVFIQNGPEPKAMVANIATGAIEKSFALPVKNPRDTHGQFRRARLTDAGTLLVAHMDLGKVVEYDDAGKAVWSAAAPGCWSASRLKTGNTLICASRRVTEVTPAGDVVWDFTPADIPEYHVAQFQTATRLANGNTLINNWVNSWNTTIDPETAPAQAWEVTPKKKVAWALRSWSPPAALGPATTIQILNDTTVGEQVRFGKAK